VYGPLNKASPLAMSAAVKSGLFIVVAGLDPAIQYPPGSVDREGGGYWIARLRGQ